MQSVFIDLAESRLLKQRKIQIESSSEIFREILVAIFEKQNHGTNEQCKDQMLYYSTHLYSSVLIDLEYLSSRIRKLRNLSRSAVNVEYTRHKTIKIREWSAFFSQRYCQELQRD